MSNSPHRTKSQLLPNRGILTKINPIVRKKAKPKNIQVPVEWNETTAQAYRLLVGPNISGFVQNDLIIDREGEEIQKSSTVEVDNSKKLLSKITPSRLQNPCKPLDVSVSQLDSLHFPGDLLFHIDANGVIPDFDFLTRSKRIKTMSKIKKLPIPDINSSSGLLSSIRPSSSDSTRTSPVKVSPSFRVPPQKNEEEEKHEGPQVNENQVIDLAEVRRRMKKKNLQKIIQSLNQKGFTKLRSYFYVLRCWACYNINARKKASFIVDISETRLTIHSFRQWHVFVARKKQLNQRKLTSIIVNSNRITLNIWNIWKSKASKAIKNAATAGSNIVKRNSLFMGMVLRAYADATKSKKIARKEIRKLFRFHPNGPFTPINDYYTKIRADSIKAKHHHFVKNVPPILKAWLRIVNRSKIDSSKTQSMHRLIRISFFNTWMDIYRALRP